VQYNPSRPVAMGRTWSKKDVQYVHKHTSDEGTWQICVRRPRRSSPSPKTDDIRERDKHQWCCCAGLRERERQFDMQQSRDGDRWRKLFLEQSGGKKKKRCSCQWLTDSSLLFLGMNPKRNQVLLKHTAVDQSRLCGGLFCSSLSHLPVNLTFRDH
jgi:hypothetical protein